MRYDNSTPASFGVATTVSEKLLTREQAEDLLPFVAGFMYAPVGRFENKEIRAKSRAVKSGVWAEVLEEFRVESERLAAMGTRIVFYTLRETVPLFGSSAYIIRYATI